MNIRIDFLRVGSDRPNKTIKHIAAVTKREPHLLEQSLKALHEVALAGRLLAAFDEDANDRFVGCIMLWELGLPSCRENWYELGTIYIEPEYRYPQIGFSIADMLYRELLDSFQHLNIIATTTNPNAIKAGYRAGRTRQRRRKQSPTSGSDRLLSRSGRTRLADRLPIRLGTALTLAHDTFVRLFYYSAKGSIFINNINPIPIRKTTKLSAMRFPRPPPLISGTKSEAAM